MQSDIQRSPRKCFLKLCACLEVSVTDEFRGYGRGQAGEDSRLLDGCSTRESLSTYGTGAVLPCQQFPRQVVVNQLPPPQLTAFPFDEFDRRSASNLQPFLALDRAAIGGLLYQSKTLIRRLQNGGGDFGFSIAREKIGDILSTQW